jgi:hypothetical protein
MRIFRLKPIILGLIFAVCSGGYFLGAAEINIPLPADAVKISEKDIGTGPFKSTVEIYQSYLPQNKINAFYKKEMPRAGWTQDKNGIFMKDGYLAVISPSILKGKTGLGQFLITTSKIPDSDQILAARKAKPDKLKFMPVYPGSIQNFLWDSPMGVSGSYETESNIQDVIFFYKTNMLNYGWNLYSEVPLKEEVASYPGSDKLATPPTASSTTLRFHRKGRESCVIMINSVSNTEPLLPGEKIVDAKNANLLTKTTILVVYND